MKKLPLILGLCWFLVAFPQETSPLHTLFQKVKSVQTSPEDSLYMGFHIKKFATISEAAIQQKGTQYKSLATELLGIPDTTLSRQEYISKQVMLLTLNDLASDIRYQRYLIPMNSEGGFYNEMSYTLEGLPFRSVEDYENYLQWLPSYVERLEAHYNLMKRGLELGMVASEVTIGNNIDLLQHWTEADYTAHPLYQPFGRMPENWEIKQKEELQAKAQSLFTEKILPFYGKFEAFLKKEYLPAAPAAPGVSSLPNGKEYYEDRVRFYTTLPVSPEEVYTLGVQEVERIKTEMEKVIKEIGFEGTFHEFFTFLRTDAQFYPKTARELLERAAWIAKQSEAQLPKLFRKLYSLPFTVAPVPDEIAAHYTAGRYVPGSWDQQRAGTYWVNTHFLESRSLFTLPALSLHEAVPGHHLQISLAQELTGLPEFRTHYYISAFGEGWGLYSEYLGEEMGMYTTPYERFGRYTYEIWRACRLVVDVGMHYKGWSRSRAVEFMQSHTALSLHEVNTEIDRYIGWPGQALSYKVGELKIKELRKMAEKALGEQFDLRDFHYHILKNGSVPLPILEEEIQQYIETSK